MSIAKFAAKNPEAALIAGAVVVLGAWFMFRGVRGVAQDATKIVTDAAGGVVVGVGQAIGLPDTNKSQCEKDLAAGNRWAASTSCPASTFIKSFFSSAPSGTNTTGAN